jgi:cytosine/adenosine deaminase-related metal-dependent hydrolase
LAGKIRDCGTNKKLIRVYFRRLMAHRKLKADKIFDGRSFITGSVLVVDEKAIVESIIPESEAGEGIETFKGILTPGFINCHCHLELSHMKGRIPAGTGLVDFVFKVVTERHHGADEIKEAIANAENEMIENGIVAVGDICNNDTTVSQKEKCRLEYYNFIEASGWLPSIAETRFERAKAIYDEYEVLKIATLQVEALLCLMLPILCLRNYGTRLLPSLQVKLPPFTTRKQHSKTSSF